jgi:dihydrofolate reductase/thymidylate synthase
MQKPIFMIVCTDCNNGIAKNGNIPWKIKEDLQLFKKQTMTTISDNLQNALIMGRKTAETLKNPLIDRLNCVLTRNLEKTKVLEEKGFKCFNSIETCIKHINQDETIENIYLIGGNEIYNWGLNNPNRIKEVYVSFIEMDFQCDQFFDKNLLNEYFILDTKKYITYKEFGFYTYTKKPNFEEKSYLNILNELITHGHKRQTRNAITYSEFGKTLEFNLAKSFPLLTTKKMAIKSIFEELKFFLLGQTDNKILKQKNVHIWDGNTTKEFIEKCKLPYNEDDMGPMYGYQWRHFNAEYKDCNTDYSGKGTDQLQEVLDLIRKDPFSRRILMTSYNPAQSKEGVLYPCHGISIQFYVEEKHSKLYLDCLMHQRSADSFLGVPFNITSYAMLVHILCNHLNCTGGILEGKNIYPGQLLMVFGDMHIYEEHIDAVKTQLLREPYLFPQLRINYDVKSFNLEGEGSIGQMEFNHFQILDYIYHEQIKAKMIA